MTKNERVFAFDIGWAFHGWAAKNDDNNIDAGVYAFEHNTAREEYVKIKREKNRKKSRNKRREQLKQDVVSTGLFKSKKDFEKFLKQNSHQNRMWEILRLAHYELIDPKDFAAILYRFAKKRHYVDMSKKIALEKSDSEQSKKKEKEEGDIKKANSVIEKIYDSLPEGSTWFQALFERREELITTLKSKNIQFNEEKFPYTNSKWAKFIDQDTYKKLADKKEIVGYELLLKNEQVAQSLEQIAQKQRALGNTHPIFSESFMKNYVKLITFKGVQPSFEDKIGLCLSGEDLKRHPISSIDAEKIRIAQLLHSIIVEVDSDGQTINEFKLIDTGLDFDTFISILKEIVTQKSANKKAEITASKLITKLKSEGYLPKKKFLFKQFKHKDKPGSAIVLRLPGHLRLLKLSKPIQESLLSNYELRDTVEFTMLAHKDPDALQEKLLDVFHRNNIDIDEKDLKILSFSDTGKPAACHNKTYRAILSKMIEGQDFQTALSESFPNALTNQKRYFRKYLNFKLYQADQRRKGINSPYQDTIIKEFVFLFNRLVQKYGEPDRIVFETTRGILSDKEKEKIEKRIQKNTELNQEITQALEEYEKNSGKKAPEKARERLKLFIQQGGKLFPNKEGKKVAARCIITGNPISLEAALDGSRTNTDHIIPQTWIHDNRLDNKILLDQNVNQSQKEDMTPIQYLKSLGHTEESAIKVLKRNIGMYTKEERERAKGAKDKLPPKMSFSQIKIRHIFETRTKDVIKKDAEDRIHSMDQRMAGEQNHAVKAIMSLLVDQLRFNTDEKLTIQECRSKVLPINGSMTNLFRRGWLPQYKKDRSQYHNHAIDALVMLNFDRSMLQRYVTLLKESYLKDKNPIWIPKEKLFPTIENFESIAMRFKDEFEEQKRVVVRREQRKYKGRVYEQTAYKKGQENSALYVKGYFKKAGSGFLKLLVYKNHKNKFEALKIHPAIAKHHDGKKYIAELYRHSLIWIKSKTYCGYYYVIGYSNRGEVELTPANFSLPKKTRIRPTFSSLLELEYIGEISITGIVKIPSC